MMLKVVYIPSFTLVGGSLNHYSYLLGDESIEDGGDRFRYRDFFWRKEEDCVPWD